MRIGFVGAGRMGLAMLKHLVKHGYQVTACDIDEKQLAKGRDAGAATAKTPAEVARAADFVIVAVGYDDEDRLFIVRNSCACGKGANLILALDLSPCGHGGMVDAYA